MNNQHHQWAQQHPSYSTNAYANNAVNPYNNPQQQQQGYIGGGQGYGQQQQQNGYGRTSAYGQQQQPQHQNVYIPAVQQQQQSFIPQQTNPYASTNPYTAASKPSTYSAYAAQQTLIQQQQHQTGYQQPKPSTYSTYSKYAQSAQANNLNNVAATQRILPNASNNNNQSRTNAIPAAKRDNRFNNNANSYSRNSPPKSFNTSKYRPADRKQTKRVSSPTIINKNREKQYDVRLGSELFFASERQYIDIKRCYPNLHISSDFTKLINHWVTVDHLDEYKKEIVIDKTVPYSIDNKTGALSDAKPIQEKASLHNGIKHNAKVMLLSGSDNLFNTKAPSETDDSDDVPLDDQHMSRKITFLVGKKERSGLMAIGGAWSPKDGSDPTIDATLIQTAIRSTQEFIGLDLSACKKWFKFTEVWYYRPAEEIEGVTYPQMQERTVLFIPDIWNHIPSTEQFEQIWTERQNNTTAQEENQESEEQEESKAEETSSDVEEKPDSPVIYCVTQKQKLETKTTTMAISLDGLLDYNMEDRLEKTFEVSLFAESFHEFLQTKYSHIIYETVKHVHQMARPTNQKKREREFSTDNEGVHAAKKVKLSSPDKLNKSSEENEMNDEIPSDAKPRDQEASNADNTDSSTHHAIVDVKSSLPSSDSSVLIAFQYFDRNNLGYLRCGDVETLIHGLGYALSRAYVHDLVSSVCEKSRLYYPSLCQMISTTAQQQQPASSCSTVEHSSLESDTLSDNTSAENNPDSNDSKIEEPVTIDATSVDLSEPTSVDPSTPVEE